ncbi:hypothetical protein OHB41_26060 [Streptomyces sp. NBC_01571]|uniref:hypothetical protein n=1 Tax=Streptomyces sp. NBC_01571 TaxID=2975883 RepID=UPI0022542824|nr:hypothetical protein [Streptomyces sp. NBC_01571]MCX4576576.1 hypothetical protein [Streptomyces sp. NBC_01571]
MAAEEMLNVIMSWERENSHRGRLVRAFKSNLDNDPAKQAHRLALLGIHAEKQAKRKAGLVPA